MIRTPPRPVVWRFRLDRVVDGDTVHGFLERDVELSAGFVVTVRTGYLDDVGRFESESVAVRLVNLDTPERGRPGYLEATADLARWLAPREGVDGRTLVLDDYGPGGFDRSLGDLYVAGDRSDTATQAMLRAGWEPWVDARDRVPRDWPHVAVSDRDGRATYPPEVWRSRAGSS